MNPRPRLDFADPDSPLPVLDKIVSKLRSEGQEVWFVFQSYEYHPSEGGDYDECYEYYDEAEFTGEEVKSRCNELADFFHNAYEKERDIIVWSEVLVRQIGAPNDAPRQAMHIPMLDYECPVQFNEIGRQPYIKNPYRNCEAFYFNSGRSLHSYGTTVLEYEEWVKFMGKALLMNSKEFPITDSRWIGHCLSRGYAALRLTCSDEKYKQLPKAITSPWVDAEDPREPLTDLTGCDV